MTLTLVSEKPIARVVELPLERHPICMGEWNKRTAGGCHLLFPPLEHNEKATWSRNPVFRLETAAFSGKVGGAGSRCSGWRRRRSAGR